MIWDWLTNLFSEPDRNPTANWQANDRLTLELDLDRHLLCGVGVGDRWDKLQFLGRGGFNSLMLSYPRLGLSIELALDKIAMLEVNFVATKDWQPFPGEIHRGGRRLAIDGRTGVDDFLQQQPAPYWTTDDDGEVVLYYEFPKLEWQVEFSQNELQLWTLRRPELADPEARESYGVTRPWPPKFS